ncbi:MAG: hypothetical protein RH917_06505, partial [Lacipirellulaceae bacterium]
GGFGISSAEDLLLVEDLVLVEQQADWASVEFKDTAVADFYDSQVDRGRTPEQFARIWIHTHPGDSPRPSGTDEETFARVFGSCNWAVMFILAQEGASYARLQFGVGPGGVVELPVEVDCDCEFPAADFEAWHAEYEACVTPIGNEVREDWATVPNDWDPHEWDAYDQYRWTLAEQRFSEQEVADAL